MASSQLYPPSFSCNLVYAPGLGACLVTCRSCAAAHLDYSHCNVVMQLLVRGTVIMCEQQQQGIVLLDDPVHAACWQDGTMLELKA